MYTHDFKKRLKNTKEQKAEKLYDFSHAVNLPF